MAKDVLTVKHLKKELGHKQVLKDVSFQAEPGEIVVITGPNGAFITTLLRILAGLTPKSGERFCGKAGSGMGSPAHALSQPICPREPGLLWGDVGSEPTGSRNS